MNKGIIFSVDAMIALIAVILFMAWLPNQLSAGEEGGNTFDNLHYQALDDAIIGFYSESGGGESISADASFGRCVKIYTIGPDNDLGTRNLETKSFCEER